VKKILALCDGAPPPRELTKDGWNGETIHLAHRGNSPNVNLHIDSPSSKLLADVPQRSADLVRIASYVYAADQAVSRGGKADVYGDSWRRELTICLPVADHAFWAQQPVLDQLQATLNFATDDTWRFHLLPAAPEIDQPTFNFSATETLGNPDAVYLFSGGLDSLCAVVEAASQGARPVLIGHSPAFHIASRQKELLEPLRTIARPWRFPYVSFATHRRGREDAKDYSQRTRSFLYAAFGAVVAHQIGLREVNIADNGVISLNLSINDQLLGARASRSTHPQFLRMFTDLCALVFETELTVHNPLWSRTRAEVIEVLKAADVVHLLEATRSCSHHRNLPKLQPHCGTCSQCIDRRFATLAAGLEEYDPGERYRLEIFRQELPEGDPRTMALSYVRFGQQVAELSGEAMFREFPQLAECIEPAEAHANQRETAEALTDMIRRHGETVVRVLKGEIERSSVALARNQLPEGCLLRLVHLPKADRATDAGSAVTADPAVTRDGEPEFEHSPENRWVKLRGREWTLPPMANMVISLLTEARRVGRPDMHWKQIASKLPGEPASIHDVSKSVPDWDELVVSRRKGVFRLNLPS